MEKAINTPAWIKVSEIEIVYRTKVKASERPQAKCSRDAYELFLSSWNPDHLELLEEFKVMLLNRAKRVLGIISISSGGICATVVDCRLIFAMALKAACVCIILCHNHPSGLLKPSYEDEQLTARLSEAGKILDIQVLDHLIISREGYFSFADEEFL